MIHVAVCPGAVTECGAVRLKVRGNENCREIVVHLAHLIRHERGNSRGLVGADGEFCLGVRSVHIVQGVEAVHQVYGRHCPERPAVFVGVGATLICGRAGGRGVAGVGEAERSRDLRLRRVHEPVFRNNKFAGHIQPKRVHGVAGHGKIACGIPSQVGPVHYRRIGGSRSFRPAGEFQI